MSQDSVADDELAAFVDRILRMKSEEDAIKADIKEIYAEAKGRGYDKTRLGETVATVRKLEKDADGEAEKEAIRDLYLTAYFRSKNKPHTHAYARGGKSTTQNVSVPAGFDPETGEEGTTSEITEPQPPQPAVSDLTIPQTLNGQVAVITHDATTNGGPHESAAHPVSVIDPRRRHDIETIDASAGGQTNEVVTTSAQIVTGEGAHIASVTPIRPAKLYRPLCLNRDRCGSSGPKECWKCLKAAEQGSAA